jgi:hypothetical protein
MVEEVGELKLGDGLPEEKSQKPFYGVRMSEPKLASPRWMPWLPSYRVRGPGHVQSRRFSRPKGR